MVKCTQKKSQKTNCKVGGGSTLRVSLTVKYRFFLVWRLPLNNSETINMQGHAEWQKSCGRGGSVRQKVWTLTKILSLYIRYFVVNSRFVANYIIFGRLFWAKCAKKTMLHIQDMQFYIAYIEYYSEMNLQLCNYAQK